MYEFKKGCKWTKILIKCGGLEIFVYYFFGVFGYIIQFEI